MQKRALDESEVRRLYLEEEMSLKEVAAELDCAVGTLRKRMRELGIPIRGRGATSTRARESSRRARVIRLDEVKLRALRSQGWSTLEMATEFGVSEETVRQRMIEAGIDRLPARARMERNPFWRGGLSVDKHGYILERAPHHPYASAAGYVRQHRLVMERELGRLLLPDEVVDHVDGDTSNNRPENLQVFSSNAEHLRVTVTGSKNLPADEREELRQQAVLRARRRVAAILGASESDDGR